MRQRDGVGLCVYTMVGAGLCRQGSAIVLLMLYDTHPFPYCTRSPVGLYLSPIV